jgi:hypothetical protein
MPPPARQEQSCFPRMATLPAPVPDEIIPRLFLIHGPRRWPLDRRPLTIGRLPECDITLATAQVSRIHAYVVPTPTGPLLVDNSSTGTTVNGEPVTSPWVLADGDQVRIGVSLLHVMAIGWSTKEEQGDQRPRARLVRKLRSWLSRYGWSELLGTAAAVGAATSVHTLTGSNLVAAYAGTAAECVVFYGIFFLRETIRGAHLAGGRGAPYGTGEVLRVLHGMMLEFGVAEALDSLVLRPLIMGQGMRLLGPGIGALVGKLAADVVFYGPVLSIYEWRLARGEAVRQQDRRRRTTEANRVER